ncbi:uncharacterized protein B0H18DRAFT_1119856 [Fomitopsis serialis]|uniref:uncharacterized protein n=1 Tax=Fomitopsis serialis TaxID=139415 RepID=UPI0020078B9C|nr:uncharacterized protein B0H18DRAFT_1119856 [Neoantrodia serialis]KAH9924516.1 hypothetical protein B0H18DRAFT_1119856 [Neoantrodia serialis]
MGDGTRGGKEGWYSTQTDDDDDRQSADFASRCLESHANGVQDVPAVLYPLLGRARALAGRGRLGARPGEHGVPRKAQELNAESHPDACFDTTLVSIPRAEPGD